MSEMTPFGPVRRIAAVIPISRELGRVYGLVESTPEEVAGDQKRAAESRARRKRAWETFDTATEALSGIVEQPEADLIDLHKPVGEWTPHCDGCDYGGYEGEPPEWPCRTVQTIAAYRDIKLPDPWDLMGPRPTEDE